MPDDFGRLNKYERAFLNSQLRRYRKRLKTLNARSKWSQLTSLFKKKRAHQKHPSVVTIKAHNIREKNKQGSLWQRLSNFFYGYLSYLGGESVREKIKRMSAKKKKSHKKNKKHHTSTLKKVFFITSSLILLACIAFGIWFITLEIPDVSNFDERKISNSTKIYDRTGEILLYDIHENIQRSVVEFEDINQYAKDAIIAIEDHTFYEHKGVVISSTIRAVFQTLFSKIGLSEEGIAGGSTITQQVVKNTLLNSRQLISRKVKEWILAYKIEKQLSKDEILEIYLNEAPYGGTIYGIQEAARVFFGTTADELTLAQAAYLAAIPNLPTFYSPYGPNKDLLDERQQLILRQMKEYGYITDQEYRGALAETVEFRSQEDNKMKALHFVQYIRSYLEEEYGKDMVENGGLKVITTLDYELQQEAEDILAEHIEDVGEQYNASNAALIAIEADSGQILTMVGSYDYFSEEIDGNFNVTLAERQPGSAFKPIAYANAFEEGYLPETVVFDVETQFNANCSGTDTTSEDGCYSPRNYDNEFEGPINLRNALAQSRNIPAVKVLYLGGISDTMELAREMGVHTLDQEPSYYGLGLVLGGGEVSLLELTSAYSVFANEGERNKPTGILSVEDTEGNILEEYENNDERVLSENTAHMISSILSDNVARAPLFGAQSFLYFGGKSVAGKTGTTNDNRDAWLVGYTSDVAVGVWTGNNDNSPMEKGSSISGKPWREFMEEVMKEYDTDSFEGYELPENFNELPAMVRGQWRGGSDETLYIDSRTGNRATSSTPDEFREAIPRFNPHTILHWIDRNNPTEIDLSNSDSQYNNWEVGVQMYIQDNYQEEYENSDENFEDAQENIEDPETFTVNIQGISDGENFNLNDTEEIQVEVDGISEEDIQSVDFFVNGTFIVSDESSPFERELVFEDIENPLSTNLLLVVVTDDEFNRISEQVTFDIPELE